MKVIAGQEFELAYGDVAVKHVIIYASGTPPQIGLELNTINAGLRIDIKHLHSKNVARQEREREGEREREREREEREREREVVVVGKKKV